jgi:outer membrane protein assembly factor BamE (lipoprotein component of BamABCDE complex)
MFRMAFQRAAFAVIGVGLLVLAACTSLYRDHGFAPTDAELAVLTVGKDDRETVAKAVGRPSASGLLDDKRWYFVQSRYKQRGPFAPEEIERQVVVITFAESGTVSNIERFGLEDGQVVALSRRVTDSNIEGMGSNDFIFDTNRARCVSVDVRGMMAALRHVYKADALVKELTN